MYKLITCVMCDPGCKFLTRKDEAGSNAGLEERIKNLILLLCQREARIEFRKKKST